MSEAVASGSSGRPRALVVEADGGSRGNPGVAGYGALVRDRATEQVLAELAEPLGTASNNVAEYSGLIAGLQAVLDIGARADVLVRLDSKLVVEQMAGRWKIKHEDMRRLALRARELCEQIRSAGGSVAFEWIPREQNADADALSNEAMDGRSVRRVGTTSSGPPTEDVSDPSGSSRSSARLRLVLVQAPFDAVVAARVADAVRRLVGAEGRLLVGSGLVATETASALAERLDARLEVVGDWAGQDGADQDGADQDGAGQDGADPDERARAAYVDLVAGGGIVVFVTTRRGVLTVVGEVLGTPPDRFWALATAPGSLSGVEVWANGTASVAFTNRTDHLD